MALPGLQEKEMKMRIILPIWRAGDYYLPLGSGTLLSACKKIILKDKRSVRRDNESEIINKSHLLVSSSGGVLSDGAAMDLAHTAATFPFDPGLGAV